VYRPSTNLWNPYEAETEENEEEEGAFHTVYIPHTGSFTESCDVFTHNGEYGGIMGRTKEK
jgi:hypothetical protein